MSLIHHCCKMFPFLLFEIPSISQVLNLCIIVVLFQKSDDFIVLKNVEAEFLHILCELFFPISDYVIGIFHELFPQERWELVLVQKVLLQPLVQLLKILEPEWHFPGRTVAFFWPNGQEINLY